MIEFFAYIDDSHELKNPKVVRRYFDQLTPGRWRFRIEKSNKRTLLQNDWFHAILPDILRALRDVGYNEVRTTEDAKAVIKSLFFKRTISNGTDDIELIDGTSETSKEIFTERAEEIIIWAKTYLGIDVAPPGKIVEMFQ